MSLIAKDNEQSNYPQVPTGVHKARCVRVLDLGTQKQDYQGDISWKKQALIVWEIPGHTNDNKDPLTLSKFYNLSLHEKSNLAKDLTSWRGKAFTETEKQGFDITKLLTVPCMLNVVEGNNGRPKVSNVMKLADGETVADQHEQSVSFSLDDYQKGEREIFNQLSEGIRNIILRSKELEGLDQTDSTDYGTSDMNPDTVPF